MTSMQNKKSVGHTVAYCCTEVAVAELVAASISLHTLVITNSVMQEGAFFFNSIRSHPSLRVLELSDMLLDDDSGLYLGVLLLVNSVLESLSLKGSRGHGTLGKRPRCESVSHNAWLE